LEREYLRAAEAIEAQVVASGEAAEE